LYLDTLAPAFQTAATAASAASKKKKTDARRPFNFAKDASAYQSYIHCAAGVALQESCPAGHVFYPLGNNCTSYEPAAAGASPDAPPGCKSASCACKNRMDGIFADPGNPKEGVICSLQEAHPFSCRSGFAVQPAQGCVSLNGSLAGNRTRVRSRFGVLEPLGVNP
jgi:hypothetical protein